MRKLARLFVIKTRTEAWLITYAIAAGAVERGRHYLEIYPGTMGWILAVACTGVVFLAGAKLLDSVKPAPPAIAMGPYAARPLRRERISHNRPKERRSLRSASGSRSSLRKD